MQFLEDRINLIYRPCSHIVDSLTSELEVALAPAPTILELASKFCNFLICVFSNCHQSVVAVEDYSQSVDEAEVAAPYVARKSLKVVVIESEVTDKLCE